MPGDQAGEEDFSSDDPEIVVLQMVRYDPFATIGEMKREINQRAVRVTVGWWQVWRILKRHRLLSRRARFRYARNRL
ncbi:hypothetical protein GF420_11990 [candidate division GN15 bacterium]|nr:hypothetical protein [candidate division GN15 bacterium]